MKSIEITADCGQALTVQGRRDISRIAAQAVKMHRGLRKSINPTESFVLPQGSDVSIDLSVNAEKLEILRDVSVAVQPSLFLSSNRSPIIPDNSNVTSVELRKKFPNDHEWYKRLDKALPLLVTPRVQKKFSQIGQDTSDLSSEEEASMPAPTIKRLFQKKKLLSNHEAFEKALNDTTLIDEPSNTNESSRNLFKAREKNEEPADENSANDSSFILPARPKLFGKSGANRRSFGEVLNDPNECIISNENYVSVSQSAKSLTVTTEEQLLTNAPPGRHSQTAEEQDSVVEGPAFVRPKLFAKERRNKRRFSLFDNDLESEEEAESRNQTPLPEDVPCSPMKRKSPSNVLSSLWKRSRTKAATPEISDHLASSPEVDFTLSLNPSGSLSMSSKPVSQISETIKRVTLSTSEVILSRSPAPAEDPQNEDFPEESSAQGSGRESPQSNVSAANSSKKNYQTDDRHPNLSEEPSRISQPRKSVIPNGVRSDIRSFKKSTPLKEKASGDSSASLVPLDATKPTPIKKLPGYSGDMLTSQDSSPAPSEKQPLEQKIADCSARSDLLTAFNLENVLNKLHERIPKKTVTNAPPAQLPRMAPSKRAKTPQEPTRKKFKLILPDGKVYKTPKLSKPKKFVSDKMYRIITKRIKKNTEFDTRVRAEEFVKRLCYFYSKVIKRKKSKDLVDDLLKEMVQLGLVSTYSEFYSFVENFMPDSFRVKAIPCFNSDLAPKPKKGIYEKLDYND